MLAMVMSAIMVSAVVSRFCPATLQVRMTLGVALGTRRICLWTGELSRSFLALSRVNAMGPQRLLTPRTTLKLYLSEAL